MEENKNITKMAEQQNNVLFQDACLIIDQAQAYAYRLVNETLIKRNWLLGMRIQHEVLKGQRAEYGEQVVKALAKELTAKYGEGFTWRNLYNYIDFYSTYSGFFMKENGETANVQTILHAVRTKSENISVLNDSDQLFAAKYLTYIPTEEELRREIEQQKEFFLLQHKED